MLHTLLIVLAIILVMLNVFFAILVVGTAKARIQARNEKRNLARLRKELEAGATQLEDAKKAFVYMLQDVLPEEKLQELLQELLNTDLD